MILNAKLIIRCDTVDCRETLVPHLDFRGTLRGLTWARLRAKAHALGWRTVDCGVEIVDLCPKHAQESTP